MDGEPVTAAGTGSLGAKREGRIMDRRSVRAPRPTRRRTLAAGIAGAIALLMAGATIGSANAGAADSVINMTALKAWPAASPSGTVSTEVDGPAGPLTLTASPARGLPPAGAQVTVRGSGFDPGGELWVAVCQDDGVAPAALVHCLGGPIPDSNGSSSWGVITADGRAPYAGPVAAKWRGNGSFTITLQLLAASGQDADCIDGACSVYVRSADDANRDFDAQVPLRFAAPPTTAAPSTQTVGAVATTVSPDMVLQTSIAAGDSQTIVFTGFKAGEKVDVTLYSDPITLPVARADGAGTVTITFDVPPDLPQGEHLIQAVGRQSGRVGIAQFAVGEPASTETTAETTGETGSETSAELTDTAMMTALATDLTTAEVEPPSAEISTAEPDGGASTTSDAAGALDSGPAQGSTGAGRYLWLWLALAAIVLIGGAAGVMVLLRRRGRDEQLPLAPVEAVVPAPAWDTGGASWPLTFGDSRGGYGGAGAGHGAAYDDAGYGGAGYAGPGYAGPGAGQGDAGYGAADADDPGPATQQWQPDWSPPSSGWTQPEPPEDPGSARGRHYRPE